MDKEMEKYDVARSYFRNASLALDSAKLAMSVAIRHARKEKGMSFRDLAGKVKVSAAFLNDIELGRRFPSDSVLSKIIKVLKND